MHTDFVLNMCANLIRGLPYKTNAVGWGEGRFVQCGQMGRRGSSDVNIRTFWHKKLQDFLEIYGVSARTRGEGEFEPVWAFCGQGVIFL